FELGWQKIMLLSWATVPLLLGYAISIAGRPLIFDRYLIVSLPPLLLLAAKGLQLLRFNRTLLGSILAALFVLNVRPLYGKVAEDQRENFRSTVADFAARYRASDEVFFSFGTEWPVDYYFRASIRESTRIIYFDNNAVDLLSADGFDF